MLEPIDTVDVLIDDDYVGAVMGDLSSRRARVLGTEAAPGRRTVVHAEVPGARAGALRDRPALAEPRHRLVLPPLRPLRAAAQPPGRQAPPRLLTIRGKWSRDPSLRPADPSVLDAEPRNCGCADVAGLVVAEHRDRDRQVAWTRWQLNGTERVASQATGRGPHRRSDQARVQANHLAGQVGVGSRFPGAVTAPYERASRRSVTCRRQTSAAQRYFRSPTSRPSAPGRRRRRARS